MFSWIQYDDPGAGDPHGWSLPESNFNRGEE
jgi:hypothetical protein